MHKKINFQEDYTCYELRENPPLKLTEYSIIFALKYLILFNMLHQLNRVLIKVFSRQYLVLKT
jgi:hypothetical protein